jgi:peptidyl-prolyl cis-trans isomerase SurA
VAAGHSERASAILCAVRTHRLWIACIACVGTAAAVTARGDDATAIVDGIAAHVDGRIVLYSEVLRAVRPQEQAMRAAGAPEEEIAKLRAEGLERMIESRLIEKVVEETDSHASDEEVARAIEGIAKENGLSIEQLYASVVFHGLSVEEYRAQIKQDLERRNLINGMLGSRITVEDEEVKALYDERYGDQGDAEGESVHVRQILRAYGGEAQRDQDTACAEARAARERVLAGEPFEKVAAEVSEVAPRDGGDIGWLPLDSVASWMSKALDGLSPGGVSEVLALPFGCSVLQLVERRDIEPVTFEAAREVLHRELWERKLEQEYRSWIDEIRGHSYIERRGYFADAARLGQRTFPTSGEPQDEPTATP